MILAKHAAFFSIALALSRAGTAVAAPPVVHSVTATPSTVTGGEEIGIIVKVTDDDVGVNVEKLHANLLDPKGKGQHIVYSNWVPIADNTYSGHVQISQFAMSGAWQVYWVQVYDSNDNTRLYRNGSDYNAKFSVVNTNQDIRPPTLHRAKVDTPVVSVFDLIQVTLVVSDDRSGVDLTGIGVATNGGLLANLTDANGGHHHQIKTWTQTGSNTYVGTVMLTPNSILGPWVLYSVIATDIAGNQVIWRNGNQYTAGFKVVRPSVPRITVQPQGATGFVGSVISFNVTAIGTNPLKYQWLRNGALVVGATNRVYSRIVGGGVEDGDEYRVVVSNPNGAVTSIVAGVRLSANGNYQGIVASQAPDVWYRLDNSLVDSGALMGGPITQFGGTFGPDFENFARLAYYVNDKQRLLYQTNNIIPECGSFSMLFRAPNAAITGTRHVFGHGTDTEISNAFNLVFANPDLKLKVGSKTINLAGGQPVPNAWYYLGATWNATSAAPSVDYVYGRLGQNALSGSAALAPGDVIGVATQAFALGNNEFDSYGGFHEGTDAGLLSGGGIDEFAVWNRQLVSLDLLLQFAALSSPSGSPAIIRQPANLATLDGANATFSVDVIGQLPLSYQWFKNGSPLPGEVAPALTAFGVGLADDGAQYHVVISNNIGMATSVTAFLSVNVPRSYQATVLGQLPDYYFPLDASLGNIGALPAPDLFPMGGDFGSDNLNTLSNAWDLTKGNGGLSESQDIIPTVGSMTLLYRTPEAPIAGFRHVFAQGGDETASNAFNLSFANPDMKLKLGSLVTTLQAGVPATNAWHYFGLTWDENRNSGEVNWYFGPLGGSLASGSIDMNDAQPIGNGGTLYLGNKDTGFGAFREGTSSGAVDEAAIWTRELALVEIAEQFATAGGSLNAPFIYIQPVDRQVTENLKASFSVAAIGAPVINYQWQLNGVDIPGANGSSYVSTNLVATDDGNQYRVLVANGFGVTTSSAATVTIVPMRSYQQALFSQAPDYWFVLDNTLANFGAQPAPDLASKGAFGEDNLGTMQGAFDIIAGNDYLQQANDIIPDVGTLTFLFRTPALPYTGFRHVFGQSDSNALGNAFNLQFANPNLNLKLGGVATTLQAGQPLPDTWHYFGLTWDVNRNAGEANWYFGALGGTLVSGTVNIGDADLIGDGGPVFFGNKNTGFSAFREGSASSTVDEIAIWASELTPADIEFLYRSHTVPYSGPTISSQPMDSTVELGLPAAFSVGGSGIGTLSYQWFSNGAPIAAATGPTFPIAATTYSMSNDQYFVTVSDVFGAATSMTAVLTVIPPIPVPPVITSQPGNVSATAGDPVTFSVGASGSLPLYYLWWSNASPIPGATTPTLTLSSATLAMSGNAYRVTVSNSFGITNSLPATLSVFPVLDYTQTVRFLNPDYWFNLNNNLANSGSQPAGPLVASGTAFGPDNFGDAAGAGQLTAIRGFFEHGDLIAPTGTMVTLFRTPDAVLPGFRILLAQGFDTTTNNAFSVYYNNPDMRLRVGESTVNLLAGTPPAATWYYLAVSWDESRDTGEVAWWFGDVGGTLTTGVLNIGDASFVGNGGNLYLGNRDTNSAVEWRVGVTPGSLDEISIWKSELSGLAISNLFKATVPPPPPSLPPSITVQPVDRTNLVGSAAEFSVAASGSSPLYYLWHSNGVVMAGEIAPTLTLSGVTLAMSGTLYHAVVSNTFGLASSTTARLTVYTNAAPPGPGYQATLASQNPQYWYRLDGDLTNSGSSAAGPLVFSGTTGGFGTGAFGDAGGGYTLVANNDVLQQATDIVGPAGTMTMLFRTPDAAFTGTRYLFAQGFNHTASSNAFCVIFSTQLKLRLGNASVDLVGGTPPVATWYYLAVNWDESRDANEVNYYFGPVSGTLSFGTMDLANSAVVGDGGTLYLGSRDAVSTISWRQPAAPGTMDEVALWTAELMGAQISNQFAAVNTGLKRPGRELRITAARFAADGRGLELELDTDPGTFYVVEWTSDAVGSFSAAGVLEGSSSNSVWSDSAGSQTPQGGSFSDSPVKMFRYRSRP